MAFDQPTRNRLARFVGEARTLLSEEFTRQLQNDFGLDPARGDVTPIARLGHLDDARRETARILRETLAHYLGGETKPSAKARQEALDRIVREQAFTVLNRLCALRIAEARDLLVESIARGYQSKGFQLYARLAGTALGETGDAYRIYLLSLFDEFALDLAVLFDRFSPEGRLFPREAMLVQLLELINDPEIAPLWSEDETIGWIYQYFNSKEERQKMRAESQAPRNSRELAVRNQFFTPRYVVEFLTDNTLGRIWYEMTQGRTRLVETCRYLVRRPTEIFLARGEEAPRQAETAADLSQEELLRQPVYITHRPLKDPRTILMLDSACGSMHFGLYSFDLYEVIYEEAWELETAFGPAAFQRPAGFRPLQESYPDKQAFLRDVPRLIIEHNIHGIDIDPRAVQIAGLSLWLRAQRSWRAQGIKAQDRPVIRKSNIVCAEPMPGNQALLEEFLAGLREDRLERLIRRVLDVPATQQVRATARMADALCDLVRLVWQEMRLAGEAGSLLKIEETLANAVATAEREWSERMPLFRVVEFGLTGEADRVRYPRGVPGEEGADFWARAEALVLAALQDYAEQAQNGAGYQRRLFALDAVRGFAFVDLCRKQYDAVLMNPPFGNPSVKARSYLSTTYPKLWADIYAAFVERTATWLCDGGRIGAITSRTFLALSSFEALRELLLMVTPIQLAVECGLGVLDDATVRAAFFVAERTSRSKHLVVFWNLRQSEDRGQALIESIHESGVVPCFRVASTSFEEIPGKPFAYWLPNRLMDLLRQGPHLDSNRLGTQRSSSKTHVAVGASTTDDMRFVRCHWEVAARSIGTDGWTRFAHGVGFSRYYSPTFALIKWFGSGHELLAVTDEKGNTKPRLRCPEHFFKAGLVSPYISERGLGCSFLPSQHIVSNSCRAYFDIDGNPAALLSYLNSELVDLFVWALTPDRKHEAGIISAIPVPKELWSVTQTLSELARISWQAVVSLRTVEETDPLHRFRFDYWDMQREGVLQAYIAAQSEIDQLVGSLVHDPTSIKKAAQEAGAPHDLGGWTVDVDDPETDTSLDKSDDSKREIFSLLASHCIGTCFGCWDIRYTTGEQSSPDLPDPFDPLPICPPGMLQNADGLPAAPADVPPDYPLRISWPGILVDAPGHPEDIESRVRDALRVIWLTTADSIEQEACRILGVGSLREYFVSPNRFFDDHLKRYSKSRRAAPIYWPLSTPSGRYTLWLYYHRLTDQMLYTCVNDFVDPKLAECSRQLAGLRTRQRSGQDERELERLNDLEAELKEFRTELLRIAQFWRPNLNDGVQITAAPLWRLFRHRGWQKRLQETWQQLKAGDYDWAHLAMSTWPGRVVPKCVDDRSLAIAHEVEDLFWVEDVYGWRNLRSPAEEIEGQKQRQRERLGDEKAQRVLTALSALAAGPARSVAAQQVAQHLAEGHWDDTEVARLFWPERVAEKCLDDPFLASSLAISLPAKLTKTARKRFVTEMVAAGCPGLAAALLASLADEDVTLERVLAELQAGRRDHAPLALALWPERVVDKCAVDVELATIHDLHRFFWVQRPDGSWRRRVDPRREVADEVQRRS